MKQIMKHRFFIGVSLLFFAMISCKKNEGISPDGCLLDNITLRKITNKQAVVKVTGTIHPVYLIEQGSIDNKLVPCNFPKEFVQHDLQVLVSGTVKFTPQLSSGPCCIETLVISKISRR